MASCAADRWSRLDAALGRSAPAVLRTLRPPLAADSADAAWLADLDRADVGIAAAYRAHDGSTRRGGLLSLIPLSATVPWARMLPWLAASAVRKTHADLLSTVGDAARELVPISRVPPFRNTPAHEREYDEGEELSVIAIERATGGLVALNYSSWGPKIARTELGVTWNGYLDELLAKLEAGGWEAGLDDYNVLRIERAHPGSRIPGNPTSGPRDDLGVLLQLLVERGQLMLRGEPSPRFLAQATKALRKRSADGRLAALQAALDDADEVEDYSASDEQLAALIELVKRG